MSTQRYSPKQATVLLEADARWNILCGAVRSGKTRLSLDLLLRRLTELPDGGRLLIGRTMRTVERNVLDPLRKRLGKGCVGKLTSKGEVQIAGKTFLVSGADNKDAASKLQGLGLVYAYGDEITTWHESVFEMLKSRLCEPGATFDGTCNPAQPSHWLKRKLLDRPELNVKQWHFTIDDNPFLPPDFVKALKQEYSGVYYERYILGKWCGAEGLVYPMFDPAKHVSPTIPRPYEEYRLSIDYGTFNPFHALLWGLWEGVWYCVRELRHHGREEGAKDPTEYADMLRDFTGKLPISQLVIDPSADAFIALLLHQGHYPLQKAANRINPGIEALSVCLNRGLIRINDCCRHVIQEFGLYCWDDKGDDKPVPRDDHGMDAARYFVYTNRIGCQQRQIVV